MTEQKTDETAKEKSGRRIDLKPTQAAASGLAAVTVAILGSEFGWAGSVFGAGLASVVTTVASTLYQQTLDKTKETVKEKVVAKTAPYPRNVPNQAASQLPGSQVQGPASRQGNLMHQPPLPRNGGSPLRPQTPGAPGYPQSRPTQGQPTQGQPTQGQPTQGQPTQGQPTQGQPNQAQPNQAQTQRPTQVNLGDQQAKTFSAIDPTTIIANQKTQLVRPVGATGQGQPPTQAMPGQGGPTQAMPAQHGNLPPNDPDSTQVIGPASKGKRSLRWPMIIGVSAAAFLFGLLILTGLEAIKGGSLLGDHPGTSIGRAVGYTPDKQPEPANEQPGDTTGTTETTEPTDGSTAPTTESQTEQTEESQTEQTPGGDQTEQQQQQPQQDQQQGGQAPPNPQGGQAPPEQDGSGTGSQQ